MWCSLFPKAIFFTLILLHCSWCFCYGTAVECLLVYHYSADYVSFPYGSLGPIVVYLKMEFCSCIR